jgi:hemerythrin-like domain-containing protein
VGGALTLGIDAMQSSASWNEILRAEHEVILAVLDCLEKLAGDAARKQALDLDSALEILDFLGAFADRYHHGKEERALFPALCRRGMPCEVGLIAVKLAEREQGRSAGAAMRAAATACQVGERGATECFATAARAYCELLRKQIAVENGVLFPLAEGLLGERGQAEVLAAFDDVERDHPGAGAPEEHLALASELAARLGVTRAARPRAAERGATRSAN